MCGGGGMKITAKQHQTRNACKTLYALLDIKSKVKSLNANEI